MRWAALSLLLIVCLLIGIALWKADGSFQMGLKRTAEQTGQFLPILCLAFLIMGFVDVLLPRGFVERWLSDAAGWRGIGIAWIAGILMPAGSLVGLPLVAGLYKAGVGIGVLITFLTSTALLSLIRLPLEVGIYGWKLTSLRIAVTFFLPPFAGLLALLLRTRPS